MRARAYTRVEITAHVQFALLAQLCRRVNVSAPPCSRRVPVWLCAGGSRGAAIVPRGLVFLRFQWDGMLGLFSVVPVDPCMPRGLLCPCTWGAFWKPLFSQAAGAALSREA